MSVIFYTEYIMNVIVRNAVLIIKGQSYKCCCHGNKVAAIGMHVDSSTRRVTSASSSAVHIHAAVCGCRSKEWLKGTWNYLVISACLQMITHLANASRSVLFCETVLVSLKIDLQRGMNTYSVQCIVPILMDNRSRDEQPPILPHNTAHCL